MLDERKLTVRAAQEATGVAAADFSRIRKANLGRFTIDAINNRDFMALQGAVVVLTVGFVLVNFFVDILHGFIDPRIRTQASTT